MKEKIKLVIVFITGIMISVVISVYAATVISAGAVSYIPGKVSASNVQDTIDGVHDNANTLATNITKIKNPTLLWSGTGANNTSYNLSQSYKNFSWLLVMYQAASNFTYKLVYTASIPATNFSLIESVSANDLNSGNVAHNMHSTATIAFTSNTTFKVTLIYDNNYWPLVPIKIYGIV